MNFIKHLFELVKELRVTPSLTDKALEASSRFLNGVEGATAAFDSTQFQPGFPEARI